ncbi:DUF2510 domain-containing protein [Gordonia sp. DT101]|uniref:DUF2510 domain-containing protein n=1 Tax=Gordonia sp. DT101 TaxID=3416545 RepID=UPI003CE86591
MSAPPAWYPDPAGRHQFRYWNGQTWTEHVADAGQQGIDPLASTEPSGPAVSAGVPTRAPEAPDRSASPAPHHHRPFWRDRREARDAFETTAVSAAHGDRTALRALPAMVASARDLYRGKKYEDKAWEVFRVAAHDVLADDIVSTDEEQHLEDLASALAVPYEDLAVRDFELLEDLVVAQINDGRLPVDEDAPLLTKPDEVAYYAPRVSLMKETDVREFRGGSRGVSVRLAKGLTYRVGDVRGRSVVVGSELKEQDTGQLVITDRRAVFIGRKRTLEFRYDKLVAIEQYADGLRLNVSNRQLASIFIFQRNSSPSIAAALLARLR